MPPTPRTCPACDTADSVGLPPFAAQHLVKCRHCRLVYASLQPSSRELGEYYANYPFVASISPITLLRYDELLMRFAPYRRQGRILDVGCGAGHFLERAMHAGWQVQGTEFGARSIKACQDRGIPVKEGALNPADFSPASFDVVCSFEVVEHLVDPQGEIDKMLALLRPGGLLYLTVPNFNCIARRADPSNWNVASYPEHLNYFTPRTLHALLTAKGLKRSWLTTTGISIERWKTKRTAERQVRQQAHQVQEQFRERLEARWYLKFAKASANRCLSAFALGDSLKAAYVKPAP